MAFYEHVSKNIYSLNPGNTAFVNNDSEPEALSVS